MSGAPGQGPGSRAQSSSQKSGDPRPHPSLCRRALGTEAQAASALSPWGAGWLSVCLRPLGLPGRLGPQPPKP